MVRSHTLSTDPFVNIVLCRAYTTTKEEAFASPNVFWESSAYLEGDNSLTLEEEMLIAEYERRDRLDLAECVRNGRKYHRLFDVLGQNINLVNINALTDSFLGEGQVDFPKTLEDWKFWAVEKYEGNEGLRDVMERVAHRELGSLNLA